MITLRGKLKKDPDVSSTKSQDISNKRVSIRDKLLIKEVQEMEQTLPATCQVTFNDPHCLYEFILLIVPDEGYWCGGRFYFKIHIPEEYNMIPPKVKCLTKLWHPNISEDGDVCLSILRQNSIDGMGWAPTRKLKDIVWGLSSLFTRENAYEKKLHTAGTTCITTRTTARPPLYTHIDLYTCLHALLGALISRFKDRDTRSVRIY